MQTAIPKEVSYFQDVLPVLPANSGKKSTTLTPIQGAGAIAPGGIFSFDLPTSDFLDVNSMYLSYRMNYTIAASSSGLMMKIPFFTALSSCAISIGGVQIESISNYAQVQNVLMDISVDPASRYGSSYTLGLENDTTGGMEATDGRTLANVTASPAAGTLTLAGPIVSSLSNCHKLFPLCACGTVRIQLTFAQIIDMFTSTTFANVSGVTFDNIELHFDQVSYGQEVEQEILSQGKIYIKSQSYATNSQVVSSALGSGSYDFNIPTRVTSARNIILMLCPNGTGTVCKNLESSDWSSGTGYYQIFANGVAFPSRAISALNKSVFMQELKKCSGDIFDLRATALSINNAEFSYNGANCVSAYNKPAKFYFGVNLSKNSLGADNLLGGISTNASGLNFRFITGTDTLGAGTIISILNYDCIYEIDPVLKQVYLKV